MPGKTISMHASGETAQLLEYLARVEDRSPSQIAAAALAFYLRLPPEAHAALRHVQALGTTDDARQVVRGITRLLLNAQYEIAVGQLGRELGEPGPDTEEAMLDEAARLVAGQDPVPAPSRQPRAGTRKGG
jgi:hypothetical protein